MSRLDRSPHVLFAEGLDARQAGEVFASCPYPAGSVARVHWIAGWHEPNELNGDEAPDDPLSDFEGP